jgi:diadenosine tetraphosphate (Ap4A) HIT family hydrolase
MEDTTGSLHHWHPALATIRSACGREITEHDHQRARQAVRSMMMLPDRRESFDQAAYDQRARSGPCFICELLAGNPGYRHHVVYQDDVAVVFLNKYPVLDGYLLVAPVEHREHVTGDFSLEEYLAVQRVLYTAAEAVRQIVPTERLYLLSLGSQQGNRHVHWHVAPLPPGVPYEQQQGQALSTTRGLLKRSDEEFAALATRIHRAMAEMGTLPSTSFT